MSSAAAAAAGAAMAAAASSTAATAGGVASRLARGMKLKDVCTQVMIKYTPNVPSESFLYRGNAYMELGLPYFALADYRFAAAVLPLSGKHEKNAQQAIQELPTELIGAFPASDEHLSQLIESSLYAGLEIRKRPTVGNSELEFTRGLFVKRGTEVKEGQVLVLNHRNYCLYPLEENCCCNCAKQLGLRTYACRNDKCHEEYCSRECRNQATALYHGGSCDNATLRGMELEHYSDFKENATELAQRFSLAVMLLTLRVLSIALAHQCVPSLLREVRTLPGLYRFNPTEMEGGMMQTYIRFVQGSQTLNSISFEEFVGVYARVHANSVIWNGAIVLDLPTSVIRRVSHFGESVEPNASLDIPTGRVVAVKDLPGNTEIVLADDCMLPELPSASTKDEHSRGC